MISRHTSRASDPRERGLEYGGAQRVAIHGTVDSYCRRFERLWGLDRAALIDLGRRVEGRLTVTQPALADELTATASGAGVDVHLLFAMNARTEILAGAARPECSVIGALPSRTGAGPLLAQNWDWYGEHSDKLVVWTIEHDNGLWHTTLTEAGIVAKVGLNSRGVGVALNILGSSADGGVNGDPVHILLRTLLEQAEDLASAERLLRSARASASSCITVAEATGDGQAAIASYELSPAGVTRIEPIDGVILHTNHFLEIPEGLTDTMLPDWPDSTDRLDDLRAATADPRIEIDADAIKAMLSSHAAGPVAVCCHGTPAPAAIDQQRTLISLLIDLDSRVLEIAEGNPCTHEFEPIARPFQEAR